jgi:hypothetical protein
VAMAHNGILAVDVPKGSDNSDTVEFIRQCLCGLSERELMGGLMREELEQAIGGNRLVFLSASGKLSIVNAKLGEWEDRTWYSNTGYQAPTLSLGSGHVPLDAPLDDWEREYLNEHIGGGFDGEDREFWAYVLRSDREWQRKAKQPTERALYYAV